MNLGDGPTAAELDVTLSRAHVIDPPTSRQATFPNTHAPQSVTARPSELDLEAVEELVRQLAWRARPLIRSRPGVLGRMLLASLTRSDQRRVGISFGS
jgi:hypothetical protein